VISTPSGILICPTIGLKGQVRETLSWLGMSNYFSFLGCKLHSQFGPVKRTGVYSKYRHAESGF